MNRALALLLALSFFSPVVAHAGDGSLVLDPLPAELRAGDVVTLRWSEPGHEVEEMEVLLSVDGGRSYPLRVSPELDARSRAYRWRVPELDAAAARLRIRVGHRDGERECPPSAPFRIAARPATAARRPTPGATVHEAGWWDGWDATAAGGGGALAAAGEAIGILREPALFVGPQRTLRGMGSAPPRVEAAVLPLTLAADLVPTRQVQTARPARVPMRN